MTRHSTYQSQGFSLIEMAVVLVIVGLLVTGLLLPLSAQIDQRNYNETQRELSDMREALLGYALSSAAADGNPHLPCPDTNGDGFEDRVAGACVNAVASIPWATLGIGRFDRWGNRYIYRVTLAFANSNVGFNLGTIRDNQVLDAAGGPVIAANVPAVILSKGKTGAGAGANELENSDGDTIFVDRTQTNAVGNAYDDAIVWLPSAILFNRMVAAGRLP
ncbi:MAG: general secretion pathway protein GspH [Methylophilaceae bacterium 17-44-8]|jgi:prepilin-type N-terminal cleavage/methylation domain-containing protein|nr:MAG: general secretion pathway protein GspH [Methylophilales bacterium 28-44-11]OZA07040.1 MAG: general secretion pathway protein GspH [Methylophilaceae bacterium 17-44-8]